MKRFIVRIGLGIVMGGLLWGGLSANPAMAASLIYSFSGDVDRVGPRLSSNFDRDQLMSGLITVDSSGPINHPGIGTYSITDFELHIGSYSATMGPSGQVVIKDRLNGLDRLIVTENAPIGPIGSLVPSFFDIKLRGLAGTLSDDALPTTPPDISSVFTNFNQWRLVFGPAATVAGTVTNMTAVPLPAAMILFGAGLIALVGLGAGSWRKRNNSLA